MKFKILLVWGLFFLATCAYAQIIVDSKAELTNVDFFMQEDKLVITYDLLNTKPDEKYLISVNIVTETDKPVNAKSFSGDVGENISGGAGKRIIWNISDDIAYLDDKISVKVSAIYINPRIVKPTSRGKAMLLSTLLPGLGCSKTTLKPIHLVKGIAGYGCIAGSFYFNNKSNKTFADYQDSDVAADRDRLFDQSVKEKNLSDILIYSGGAVWLIEYVNILIARNHSRNKGFKSEIVSFSPYMDIDNNYKGISMIITF